MLRHIRPKPPEEDASITGALNETAVDPAGTIGLEVTHAVRRGHLPEHLDALPPERGNAGRERDASAWSYVLLDVTDRAPGPRIPGLG